MMSPNKHHCTKMPKGSQIEHDEYFGWFWTTKDTMCEVNWCPFCGSRLIKPREVNNETYSD